MAVEILGLPRENEGAYYSPRCECGHRRVSHGSFSVDGEPVPLGGGPCGIELGPRGEQQRCECNRFSRVTEYLSDAD